VSERIRVAVVGAGVWGEQHARVFAARSDTKLCGIGGRTPERTQARAAAFGVPAYTNLEQMLKEQRPDLVSVCLPNESHFDVTLQLIRHDIPLLVEKPLVFDLVQADQLITEAAQRNLFFAINFNHRYAEPVLRARAAIAAGEVGDIVFATWRFGGEPNFGAHPHANLIETQCHGFDMLEHLCGPISSVMAQMANKTHGPYTTVALALEFANGAVGTLLGTYDSSYAYPDAQLIEVNGTAARVLIEDTVKRLTISRPGDETREVWEAGYFDDRSRAFHYTFDRHLDSIVTALRADQPPPVHARAGRRALELATAAIKSFEMGTRVPVGATADPET
jgi:predicted dehydrogenase